MAQADIRQAGANVLHTKGNPLTLLIPDDEDTGYFDGKTWQAELEDGTDLTTSVISDTMSIVITAAVSAAQGGRFPVYIKETTSGANIKRAKIQISQGDSSTTGPTDATIPLRVSDEVTLPLTVLNVAGGLPLPSGTASVGRVPAVTDDDPLTLTWTDIGTQAELDAEAAARIAGDAASVATAATDATTKVDAEAALARNADNLTSGTVADARIASTIARDSEVTAAIAAQHTADIGTFAPLQQQGTTLGESSLDGLGDLQLDVSTHWGVHLGVPYYEEDPGDVTAGEEAILHVDETGAVTWVLLSDVEAKDTAVEVEEAARIAADTALDGRVDTLETGIALKAPAANPVFTGTVTIPDGALAIADTSGLQAALDAKATAANPVFTGTVTVPDGALAIADTSGLQSALDAKLSLAGKIPPGMFIGPKNGQRGTLLLPANLIGTWIEVRNASQPIDQVVWEVATAGGDAFSVITVALYSVVGTACTRVLKTAAVQATSVAIKTDSQSATLAPGLYAAVMEATGHSATRPTIRSTFTPDTDGPFMDSTDLFSNPRGGIHQDALVNATGLPASFTLVTGTARSYGPVIGLRCA